MEATFKSDLTPIAQKVAEKRYFRKEDDGNCIEDWNKLARRVVNHVCRKEDDAFKEKMHNLIFSTKFLPNSPCLVNAGKCDKSSGIFACFVSPSPNDSWLGMINNIANFGHIARQGGGAGVDFSTIRPENDPVFGSTHAKACGPIEHMRMISEVMSSITQSGFRGMAIMNTISISHPDIEKFIVCKQQKRALKSLLKEDILNHYEKLKENRSHDLDIILDKFLSNINISVVVTDEFMEKVKKDEDFDLVFNAKIYKTVKAKYLFNLIVENAWKNGDPGMLFYDRMNDCPYKYSKQEIVTTNPCGEQVLPSWGSCNLGSIDVSKYYDKTEHDIDWSSLKMDIRLSVQFLDNAIDVNTFPTSDFAKWAKQNRPVGLGIMGFADLLLSLKLSYGSPSSLKFAEKLITFFEQESHKKSVELGKERGTPKCCQYDELENRRNITTLSIAPTGSISLLAGCSSSIEPVFSCVIYRNDNTGSYKLLHPHANKKYFRCALDKDKDKEVTWKQHIEMQSIFQKHVDAAISKTINCSNDASKDDIANVYMYAYENKCKGVTVYRDGCKTTQVLTSYNSQLGTNNAAKRPKTIPADIFKTTADGFNWHVIVGKVHNDPYEIFAVNGRVGLPKNGKVVKRNKRHYALLDDKDNLLIDNLAEEENKIHHKISLETRRFSLELRHNIHPKYIVDQIDKSHDVITSFSKAVGRIMKNKYVAVNDLINANAICPQCSIKGKTIELINEAGCLRCPDLDCGYSKCG